MFVGAVFTALVFATLIIVLRLSPKAGEQFPFLDPVKLKRTQKGWFWSFIPLGLALAAGVVLIIIQTNPILLLGGILLTSLPVVGVLGVLFMGELARSIYLSKEKG